jgi:hypothetical protein
MACWLLWCHLVINLVAVAPVWHVKVDRHQAWPAGLCSGASCRRVSCGVLRWQTLMPNALRDAGVCMEVGGGGSTCNRSSYLRLSDSRLRGYS